MFLWEEVFLGGGMFIEGVVNGGRGAARFC